jgi:hypothetical protein
MISKNVIIRFILCAMLFVSEIPTPCNYCMSQTVLLPDSVTMPASLKYRSGMLLHIANGGNYRKEWELPVKMRVFYISLEPGGLKPTKLGGGRQTKSLRMISQDSIEWVLRSVDKNVQKVLPRFLRNPIAEKFAQDMVSASHPYACLAVAVMSKALGITCSDPELVYIPDDTSLGEFRKEFAGEVCFLEERHPLRLNTTSENMEDLLKALYKENNKVVLQSELLKARLLDMTTGDWDRHQDQWRWGKYDSVEKTWYYPVPSDRDQAFFRSKGLLVRIVNSFATPLLKGFKPKISGLYQLNKPARNVDRVFLNELPESEWRNVISEVQHKLTDTVIAAAVKALPAEIPVKRKNKLARVLRNRRNGLMNAAMKYYNCLARNVYIFGSEKTERFEFTDGIDGLALTVYNCSEINDACRVYQRTFIRKQTRRIYLVGINEADVINIAAGKKSIEIIQVKPGNQNKFDPRTSMLNRLLKKKSK